MKKLVFLFAAVLFTAISAKTFAQESTGITPAPGATHEYSITAGDATNNAITWWVTFGDLSTPPTNPGDVSISDPTSEVIDITWASSLNVGDWYYVHVLEEAGGAGGCSNEKVLPVQITASPFTLDILASADAQCYDAPVDVNLNTSTHTITYDHGTATLEFTVTPSGLSSSYNGYTFNVAIDYNGYAYSTNLDDSNVTVSSATDPSAGISSGVVTVNDNNEVTITYVVDNQNQFDNSSSEIAQDYTATVTISGGVSANGVSDNTSGTHADDTSVSRPNTSGIGYN